VVGSCKHGNEPSGSIKDREFVDQLSDSHLLRNGSVRYFSKVCRQDV